MWLWENHPTALPERFGELAALCELCLANNQITALPETFGQLAHLDGLYLDWNQLTAPPESFGELTALSHLHLKGNQLTALPDTFVELTALELFGHLKKYMAETGAQTNIASVMALGISFARNHARLAPKVEGRIAKYKICLGAGGRM